MKQLFLIFLLLILPLPLMSQSFNGDSLILGYEKENYTVYQDTSGKKQYIETILMITPNGFIFPDNLFGGQEYIPFPKNLSKEEKTFILTSINYFLLRRKLIK